MRFLLNLFKFRDNSQGFFYQWEQRRYERQLESVKTSQRFPFTW